MSSAVFDPLVAFAAHARAFAVDSEGLATDRADRYEPEDHAADVAAVLDRVGRATLVGHSMGGAIAQLVAASQPQRIDKLILLNPVPAGGMPLPEDAMALFSASAGDREKRRDPRPRVRPAPAKDRLRDRERCRRGRRPRCSRGPLAGSRIASRRSAQTHVITTSDPFLPPAFLQ